jgi:pimeloyl-ACP methyl ester carboxylesterase
MKMDPLDVYERLQKTPRAARAGAQGGAAGMAPGEAAGLGDLFKGVLAGARNVLNFTTYYQMKARAGLIGAQGLAPILRNIRNSAASPLRIHLVGHSFGGRLVTAAAAGTDDASMVNADSLSLLQAAFSHHGFSADFDGRGGVGFFRRVVDGNAVSGPIVITCTTNDKAVGLAYPIASMLAGQNASALGDKDSLYGGIGSNGAQKTNEAIDLTMLSVGGAYSFTPKRLHNLNADAFIADHSDVRNREVAYAVLCAIAATP